MAIEIAEKKRINPAFVVFVLVIILIVIAIVYYIVKNRATTGGDQAVGGQPVLPVLVEPPEKITEIETVVPGIGSRIEKIIKHPKISDLKEHANLPIIPPQFGRLNPFSAQ